MKKPIAVGGFSIEQRQKNLQKLKTKLAKKGYKFLGYHEAGALKSVAVFEVDESVLRKEKSMKLIVIGVGFMVVALILFLKASQFKTYFLEYAIAISPSRELAENFIQTYMFIFLYRQKNEPKKPREQDSKLNAKKILKH